jgi:hypothetical protein
MYEGQIHGLGSPPPRDGRPRASLVLEPAPFRGSKALVNVLGKNGEACSLLLQKSSEHDRG